MNIFNIERTFRFKKEKGWDTVYVVVDLHGTLTMPFHHKIEFYPQAIEVMKWFSARKDIKLILWSSSHDKEINQAFVKASELGINFNYTNENPCEQSTDRACFDHKFYFNILLDDKAGFVPETDWLKIKKELQRIGEWK